MNYTEFSAEYVRNIILYSMIVLSKEKMFLQVNLPSFHFSIYECGPKCQMLPTVHPLMVALWKRIYRHRYNILSIEFMVYMLSD